MIADQLANLTAFIDTSEKNDPLNIDNGISWNVSSPRLSMSQAIAQYSSGYRLILKKE